MDVWVIGGGGHGSDTFELIERSSRDWKLLGVLDDKPENCHRFVGRAAISSPVSAERVGDAAFILGVGYPGPRRALAERLDGCEIAPAVVDSTAAVAASATLGLGVAVFWQSGLSPLVTVGDHSLILYGATVGHDTALGRFVSVLPGAQISGSVSIGDGVLIGAGAIVLQGRRIGDGATIGAGAVVTRDVPAFKSVVGVPAR